MEREMYVYLGIYEFSVDPAEITRLVGVEPTTFYKSGDTIGTSKLKYKSNGWQFEVSARKCFELDPLVNTVLSHFKDRDGLKNAVALGKGTITCGLFTYDRTPTILLEPTTIRLIAGLGCRFWLDYYIIPEPDDIPPT